MCFAQILLKHEWRQWTCSPHTFRISLECGQHTIGLFVCLHGIKHSDIRTPVLVCRLCVAVCHHVLASRLFPRSCTLANSDGGGLRCPGQPQPLGTCRGRSRHGDPLVNLGTVVQCSGRKNDPCRALASRLNPSITCGGVDPRRRGLSSSESLLSTTVGCVDKQGNTFRASATLLGRWVGPRCAASPTRVPRLHLDVRTSDNKERTAPTRNEPPLSRSCRLKLPHQSSRPYPRLPSSA